ncbi:MSH6 [Mytilus edulis]|uniref:MSH6 n=1 Tax=Mytilus edulis TaxID=6550 RepID=A0A8S3TNM3_MYTED|nr:MSH6 [Mytilus edulis]
MRPHLISCLEKGHFTPFPQNTTSSTDFVRIYARRIECSCQCGKPDVFENMIGYEAKRGRISCTKWNAFDHNKAKKDGVIVPNKGVDPDYDKAKLDIKMTERKLDKYLDEQRDRISCRQMVFWGSGKNRFQLEIPESALKRVPDEYDLKSSKKGWKRFWTSDIQDMLAELVEAEDRKDVAQRD